MLKRYLSAAVGLCTLVATPAVVHAAGKFSTYPIVGYPSFCDSVVSGAGGFNVDGNTNNVGPTGQGQATSGSLCAQTVPAGPPSFTGNEILPMDTVPGGTGALGGTVNPQTVTANLNQLGQGAVVDSAVAGAALTIPANAQFFVLDTGTSATVAVTMPAVAVDGQFQRLVCGVAVGTALSVVGNTGQTIKGAAPTTCTAGQGFEWRYVAAASGLVVANSWLRVQ